MTTTCRCAVLAGATLVLLAAHQIPGGAQFGRLAPQREQVVERFDEDGSGRLNREERRAARAALGERSGDGRGRQFEVTPSPGPRVTPADVEPPYPTTPLYDSGTLRTIFLEFEDADWEAELAAFYNTDVEVPATMTVDGTVYRDVGVRFRGSSSFLFVPSGHKRPLRLSVNFVHDGQFLHGYRTLNLHNGFNDPTFLRTMLYAEIARHYVPTPKVSFVRVVINGESWGVYVSQQQFNNDFVEEWFDIRGGARWKAPGIPNGRAGLEYLGDDPAAYRPLYDIKTRDDADSWDALIGLTRVLTETSPDRLETALEPILDVDGALRFLAVEMALVNGDGYWSRASDYNIYQDVHGRFHIIPHDINEAFGAEMRGGFGGRNGPEVDPLVGLDDAAKPLRSKLLAVPALRERYMDYVREIAETWLDWETLAPLLKAGHALIAPEVEADTRRLYRLEGFRTAVAPTGNPLKEFIDRRRAYLLAYVE